MEAPTVIKDQALAAAEAVLVSGLIHRPESRSAVWAQVDTIDLHPPYRQIAEAVHGLHMRDAEVSILSVLDEMDAAGPCPGLVELRRSRRSQGTSVTPVTRLGSSLVVCGSGVSQR